MLHRLRRGRTSPKTRLENTYWKLMRLGQAQVTVPERQREPYFVLQPPDKRVVGSGGCNRLAGGYTLDGERIGFTQMAGTLMACPQGMEQERKFHEALRAAKRWRIAGETLDLLDNGGAVIATFERRLMR